jgi:hypothetical protein
MFSAAYAAVANQRRNGKCDLFELLMLRLQIIRARPATYGVVG